MKKSEKLKWVEIPLFFLLRKNHNQSGDDSSSNITLSEGLDMEFEDYIVQDKDDITSIAENYYKDTKYATAIATFNGLDISEKLQAGSIIKLPNRTAISLYLAR